MTPTLNQNGMYINEGYYNRAGRRSALKAEQVIKNERGTNFTKPKKKRK